MSKISMITGFNMIGDNRAQILILGTMPSVTSLARQQYYAHPRNAFWRIIAALFNQGVAVDYEQGQVLLQEHGIAVWDVLKSCHRQGSLDSAIEKNSLLVNDFNALFKALTQLRSVFFNGGVAESLYKKNVLPLLATEFKTLSYTRLPSTSPAYAAMSYQAKLAVWQELISLARPIN